MIPKPYNMDDPRDPVEPLLEPDIWAGPHGRPTLRELLRQMVAEQGFSEEEMARAFWSVAVLIEANPQWIDGVKIETAKIAQALETAMVWDRG